MTGSNETNAAAAEQMESCDGFGCFETMLDTGYGILDEKTRDIPIEHRASSIEYRSARRLQGLINNTAR
jgi:hypothetical protein